MPESGSSGSVGEPPGNRRLYPDYLYPTRFLNWFSLMLMLRIVR